MLREEITYNEQQVSDMVNAQLGDSQIRMATELGSVNQDEEDEQIEMFLLNMEAETTSVDDEAIDIADQEEDEGCTDCDGDSPCSECQEDDSSKSTIINTGGNTDAEEAKKRRKDLIKYGAIATVALVLVILAIKFWK